MEQKRIWDYFQGEATHQFDGNYPRLRYLIDQIHKSDERVLNIGVGNGVFERIAIERGINVYSIDPSEVAIDKLKSELGLGDCAKVGLSQDLPFENDYFNVVVLSEVLEHLGNIEFDQTVLEIKRVLKSGGRFIGTVPARENLQEQIIICPKCGDKFHRWGHVQSFDKFRLKHEINRHFEIKIITEKYFVFWKMLNIKGKVIALIKSIFVLFGVKGKDQTLVFIAIKE